MSRTARGGRRAPQGRVRGPSGESGTELATTCPGAAPAPRHRGAAIPVQNAEVAERFERAADLLEIEEANPFRVRAYRRAARVLRALTDDVEDMVEEGDDLSELPAIGDSLAEKVEEVVRTGELSMLERLARHTPEELARLTDVHGLGPKRVARLHRELGVEALGELEQAAEGGEVREVPGFGEKTEAQVLEGIRELRAEEASEDRILRAEARPVAESLAAHLAEAPGAEEVEVAGSFRRWRATVGDLDVVVAADDGAAVCEHLEGYEDVAEVLEAGERRASVVLRQGLQVDLRVVRPDAFGAALLYLTGSKDHGVALRRRAQDQGRKLNEYGLFEREDGSRVASATEEEIYRALDLAWIPPELREATGELEAAAAGELPELVTLEDIRGDLHCHTTATDGLASLRDMAERARELGYEYLAITDHSASTRVAGGLSVDEMHEHLDAIARLDDELGDLALLKAAEVDILEDGALDYPEELLERFDLTVCAVHAAFDLSRERQTERLLRAMDNPHFSILAHPTGRLLGEREPYELDLDRVLEAAAARGVAVELDAQPRRLDLHEPHLRAAREAGVRVSVASDAHSTPQLAAMECGVAMARRGWLGPGDVLNTRGLQALRESLRNGS